MAQETEGDLQQTSMYHFRLTQKDTVNLLTFTKSRVHQLYNLLVNFVSNLQLPKHAEPVCLFSGQPFLNCTYHECSLSQSV